jgi:glycosyltransferase involved in cell wall biosynthesis
VLDVLIDAVRLGQSPGQRGIGTYMRHLIGALAKRQDIRLHALATASTPLPPEVVRVNAVRKAPLRLEVAEHKLLLPLQLRRTQAAVFHSPAFDPPRRSPVPWVYTLHDVIPLELDYAAGLGRRTWERYAPRIRGADAVVSVSRWSADRAIALFDLDPRRVHVIHHGVDPTYRSIEPDPDLDNPYLLYVGARSPYKGYLEAVEVVGLLAEAGYPHRLKVAGPLDEVAKQQARDDAARLGLADRVDVLGFVDDLPGLLGRACALLMTSRMEGFGLPAVEAFAAGVPVVSFDNSALHEVVDGGGVLVPDGDVPAMATALRPLLDDPETWREHSARGRARSGAFDWDASAALHAEVYRSVAAI